jgi:predicted nucleic acid-binding Zn ribbon protein
MRKPNDITLKQAIEKLLNHYKLRGKFDETGIVAMWPEIMGTAVANRTKQIYVHQRKLFVRIESSVVKNELLMVKSAIVDKLNEKTGSQVITDIVFL